MSGLIVQQLRVSYLGEVWAKCDIWKLEIYGFKQVSEGRVKASKVKGTENPADLMTKILGVKDINERLGAMNLIAKWTRPIPSGEG